MTTEVSCTALAHVAALMPRCTASEHRVLTAVALQVGDFNSSVKLSLTELEQLTGLSRSGARKGIEDAKASGHLKQVEDGNSFAYSLCHVVTQNVSSSNTKRVTKKHTPSDTCVTTKHKSLHEVTQQNEASLIPDFKERTLERPGVSEVEEAKAYGAVAYAVGHHVAEWLRDKRNFDFVRAFALWGDQLETLWKAAVHFDSRKPGDKAMFRFQDACEGSLDLGVKPRQRQPEIVAGGTARARLNPGDRARTPDGLSHVILDVCPNGMVVFEDDSPPVHLRSLEPLRVAVMA